MERVKKTVAVLLVLVYCMALATGVCAAESKTLWLNTTESSNGSPAVQIVTDITVTDGVVTLSYDSSVLTYKGIEVKDAYVAMYAVNDEEKGTLVISWVAPEAWESDGSVTELIQVTFSGGKKGSTVTMSGTVCEENGTGHAVTSSVSLRSASVSPNTGDSFNIGVLIAVMAVCVVGIVILAVLLLKKEKKGRYSKK